MVGGGFVGGASLQAEVVDRCWGFKRGQGICRSCSGKRVVWLRAEEDEEGGGGGEAEGRQFLIGGTWDERGGRRKVGETRR